MGQFVRQPKRQLALFQTYWETAKYTYLKNWFGQEEYSQSLLIIVGHMELDKYAYTVINFLAQTSTINY